MADRDDELTEFQARRFSEATTWPLFVALVGLSLWAQVLMFPFLEELQFSDPRAAASLAYVLPIMVLIPATLFRVSALMLLAFPTSFVAGILALPQPQVDDLMEPWSIIRVGATLLVYLGVAAVGRNENREVTVGTRRHEVTARRLEGLYPMYFAVRIALLVAMLVVLQYAVFFDADVVQAIEANYADAPAGAHTFIALVAFFAWCVAAYVVFFVPLTNLEYGVRRLSRRIDRMGQDARTQLGRRVGLAVAIAMVAVATALAIG